MHFYGIQKAGFLQRLVVQGTVNVGFSLVDDIWHDDSEVVQSGLGEGWYSTFRTMIMWRWRFFSLNDVNVAESKSLDTALTVLRTHAGDERVDGFWEYYRPYELTSLDEIYSFHVPNSIRWDSIFRCRGPWGGLGRGGARIWGRLCCPGSLAQGWGTKGQGHEG